MNARLAAALRALVVALALAFAAGPAAAAPVAEPAGFRGPPYKAEVPATLQGAVVIDTPAARRLQAQGVAFIDVFPRTERPAGLPPGTLWRQPPHETIPGAIWLPGTGYEALAPAEAALLEAGLRAASGGDKAREVVIFCRADCWLSWNAGRRAVAMGYRAVRWYPGGSDGWAEAGGELAPAQAFVP